MKKIQLICGINAENFPIRVNPIYVFESNYNFTKKYSCWQKVIYEASVVVLLFADRIALIPRTREGIRIIDALKKSVDLEHDRKIASAQSLAVRKYINIGDYVDKAASLLSHFDADASYGLYGFFSYELINMKLGVDIPDLPLGIFYLPETISINQGPVVKYSMRSGGDTDLTIGEPAESDYEKFYDLRKFSKGESGIYESLYDLSQDYISSKKIQSLNPSFTMSKETTADSYAVYEKLKSKSVAPYNFYMSCLGCDVIGSSPAMFMRVKSNYVETSPICGTVARGKSEEEDFLRIRKLLESEKDEYELSECVRCDIEAKKISCDEIAVVSKREIEKFANVFHTSAHVTGMLRPGKTIGNVVEDHVWPSTIVGSPVAAAARVIVETEARNWYGGAFGYISINNDIDFGTMIRSAAIYRGVATTRVGSTITKYSMPELERDELRAKASLILSVL